MEKLPTIEEIKIIVHEKTEFMTSANEQIHNLQIQANNTLIEITYLMTRAAIEHPDIKSEEGFCELYKELLHKEV